MAKTKKTKETTKPKKPKEAKKFNRRLNEDKVTNVNIFEYARDIMLIYGGNVNIARSIADGRDGLKPVERRILYCAAKDIKLKPGKTNLKKVSKIIGEVMGNYYPHGDASLEKSIVDMGSWYNTPLPLIEKGGNYGTISGDSNSAARYIEGTISYFAVSNYFKDWSSNITEFMSNYSGELLEPEYLPSALPIVLIKNIFGMGFGASTGIPFFNPNEVIDLTMKLVENPNYKKVVLIPDSPTGCDIVEADWKTMCETGYGTFRYRASAEIHGQEIRITSIPHRTTIRAVLDKVVEAKNKKKFEGIDDILDHSKETEESINVDLRVSVTKGFSPEKVLETLYKITELENTFVVKFDVVYEFENFHLSLRAILLNWLEFRRETKRRFYSSEYSSVRKKMHLYEAIVGILSKKSGEDKFFKVVRKSKNKSMLIDNLIEAFGLSDIQAETLTDFKMYNLTTEHMSQYKETLAELTKKEKKIKRIKFDDELVDAEILEELKWFKENFNMPRKSKIISGVKEKKIPNTDHTIVITKNGLIKKMGVNFDGVGELQGDDKVKHIIKVNNRECLLLFDSQGQTYGIEVNDIPDTGTGDGIALNNLIKLKDAKIVAVTTRISKEDLEKETKPVYLVFATKNGIVKKSLMKHYSNIYSSGVIGINIKKDDELIDVTVIQGDKQIILYTKNGMYIKYNTKEISETLRTSSGVIGIKLKDKDKVLGMDTVKKDKEYLIIITDKGNGKKCLLRNFDSCKRAESGLPIIKLDDKEHIAGIKAVKKTGKILVMTTKKEEEIKVEDIPELIKLSKGRKLLGVPRGDKVIGVD